MANSPDYADIKFPVSKSNCGRIERKNSIYVNVFGYENSLVYPIHISGEKLENCVDLLLIADGNESHYVYIKDLNRLDWATQFFLS